jgi:hypothetical protein
MAVCVPVPTEGSAMQDGLWSAKEELGVCTCRFVPTQQETLKH